MKRLRYTLDNKTVTYSEFFHHCLKYYNKGRVKFNSEDYSLYYDTNNKRKCP